MVIQSLIHVCTHIYAFILLCYCNPICMFCTELIYKTSIFNDIQTHNFYIKNHSTYCLRYKCFLLLLWKLNNIYSTTRGFWTKRPTIANTASAYLCMACAGIDTGIYVPMKRYKNARLSNWNGCFGILRIT